MPVDLPNLFLDALRASEREPDGLLHCSTDLVTPLRFTQLKMAGAPRVARPIAQEIRLAHGTIWHNWFHKVIVDTGIKFRHEIDLTELLPEGWGGTADWLFWHPEYEAWVLGDLKTARGEAMFFINRDGAKREHIWQLSAYWHALAGAGLPMTEDFGIMYWPMNDTSDSVEIQPVVQECKPVDGEELAAHMYSIKAEVDAYLDIYNKTGKLLNPALAAMPEREQKYFWNKQMNVFDLKLVPVWYERYCDFDDTLCPRSKTEKIGHYLLNGDWVRRTGYDIEPEVRPTEAEFAKRRKQAT